jgi:hypothetical protein
MQCHVLEEKPTAHQEKPSQHCDLRYPVLNHKIEDKKNIPHLFRQSDPDTVRMLHYGREGDPLWYCTQNTATKLAFPVYLEVRTSIAKY